MTYLPTPLRLVLIAVVCIVGLPVAFVMEIVQAIRHDLRAKRNQDDS